MKKLLSLALILVFPLFISATASAQTKVGPDKCAKVCHKVQFQSWTESKHAKAAAKGADCETCHGAGSGYMTMSIMKDPAKAKAAGLIASPTKESCAKCHKPGEITDAKLKTVHAHKTKA